MTRAAGTRVRYPWLGSPAVRTAMQVLGYVAPWLVFGGVLLWRWGKINLFLSVPGYGDILEITWGISWYDHALLTGQDPSVFSQAFFPSGWHLGTFAASVGPWLFLAEVPLSWLGGPAFAYNGVVLLTFVLAFAGGLALARRFLGTIAATAVALLFTFWSFRWFSIIGHPNMLLGSALVPWILWALDRGLVTQRRAWAWYVATGLIWAAMVAGSLYFVWIGGLLVAIWLLLRRLAGQIAWRTVLAGVGIPLVVMSVLNAPGVWWSWQAGASAGANYFPFEEAAVWSASLNSLIAPYIEHPWLGNLARWMYRGEAWEQGAINLGLSACLAALIGAWLARRDKRWWPVIALVPVGVLLALGPVLKWDNQAVTWNLWRPVNGWLWHVGNALKPEMIHQAVPPIAYESAIPLPGFLLAMVVPFLERARVFARYALIAAPGIFLLAGLCIDRVQRRWVQFALAGLLVIEVIPPPLSSVPFPPPMHPAFAWLASQSIPGEAIVDVLAAHPSTLGLKMGGDTLWATGYHGQATASGASSVWPAQTQFLNGWMITHQHPFWNSDLTTILRAYHIRYLVLHGERQTDRDLWNEARSDPELGRAGCFQPVPAGAPWSYPICILEVLPSPAPNFNVLFDREWSGQEPWGRWAEGTRPVAQFIATGRREHALKITAFPNCAPGKNQEVRVEVNGVALASYRWPNCEPWSVDVTVPASLVRVGTNDVLLRAAYAISPAELKPGESNDTRALSIGLTEMKVEPKP